MSEDGLDIMIRQAAADAARWRAEVEGSSGLDAFSTPAVPGLAEQIPGYDVADELHRGAQGAVYRATQITTGRCVAIKVFHELAGSGGAEHSRFAREADVLLGLRHPGVVTLLDKGEIGRRPYFVMEYVEGEPLDRYLASHPLPIRLLLAKFVAICDAVNAAHLRGILHRDLKPANILIDMHGEPHVVDFGLAKSLSADAVATTRDGQFVGSIPWASPEQIYAQRRVFARGVALSSARGPVAVRILRIAAGIDEPHRRSVTAPASFAAPGRA